MTGELPDIRASLPMIIRRISEALELVEKARDFNETRLVIASNMVAIIIGRGGMTIKEIHKNCHGAVIRVLSERNGEREHVEVKIKGPTEARIDATRQIFEKLNEKTRRLPPPDTHDRKEPVRRSRSRSRSHDRTRSVKTAVSIAVPDTLVSRLIGKGGENVKAFMSRSGCVISFQKQSDPKVQTPTGSLAQLCTVEGSPEEIGAAVKMLLNQIQEFEKRDLP